MPDDTQKTLVRIETRLEIAEKSQRERDRTIGALESAIKHISEEVSALRAKSLSVDAKADLAMRRAQDSVHEIQGVSNGLMAHLNARDKAHDARAASTTRRFEEHNDAIRELQKTVEARGKSSTWLWALGVFVIPALTTLVHEVVEGMKDHHETVQLPVTSQVEVKK